MSKNAFTLHAHTQPRQQAAALVVRRQPLACLQQTEQPFRELYSNHTTQLLGHEVACSPQSSRHMAESDRPLKWCVRPPLYPAASSIVSGPCPLFRQLHRKKTSSRDSRKERQLDKERKRKKGEKDVCCVIYHHLFSAGLPPSPVSVCKLSHKKLKHGRREKSHTFTVSEHLVELCNNKLQD